MGLGVLTKPEGGSDLIEEQAYWVLLSLVHGIGPMRFDRLLEVCGGAYNAWHAPETDMARAGLDRRSIRALSELRQRRTAKDVLERLQRLGIVAVARFQPEYPAALLQISDPPPVLFMLGSLSRQDEKAVAIVGTRRATAYGRAVAERLASGLALAGVTVVSGLAKGIDTMAHRAALDAGGRTIAVLGNGPDQIYPPENASLARRFYETGAGAIVSEFGPGVPPDAANFPRRNRIISGLCSATVIVEAGLRSGALITADYALEQGRDVLAVPGSILSPWSAGVHELLKQGATPVTGVDDILNVLQGGHLPAGEPLPPDASIALDDQERAVLAALGAEPRHTDEVARDLGAKAGDLAATLTLLELKNLVRAAGPGLFSRI